MEARAFLLCAAKKNAIKLLSFCLPLLFFAFRLASFQFYFFFIFHERFVANVFFLFRFHGQTNRKFREEDENNIKKEKN